MPPGPVPVSRRSTAPPTRRGRRGASAPPEDPDQHGQHQQRPERLLPVRLGEDRDDRRAEVERLPSSDGRPAVGAVGVAAPASDVGPEPGPETDRSIASLPSPTSGAVPAVLGAASVAGAAAPAAGEGSGSAGAVPAPTFCSRQSTNCPSSLSETSWMTPRPNCAGLPVIARSVTTSTSVESPAAVSEAVTLAPAVPLPRLSLPLASTTNRCADLVLLEERAGAGVDQRDRPELDLAGALEVVALHRGHRRRRGSTPRPYSMSSKAAQVLVDVGGDGEPVGQVHAALTPPRRPARRVGSAPWPGAGGSRRRR